MISHIEHAGEPERGLERADKRNTDSSRSSGTAYILRSWRLSRRSMGISFTLLLAVEPSRRSSISSQESDEYPLDSDISVLDDQGSMLFIGGLETN